MTIIDLIGSINYCQVRIDTKLIRLKEMIARCAHFFEQKISSDNHLQRALKEELNYLKLLLYKESWIQKMWKIDKWSFNLRSPFFFVVSLCIYLVIWFLWIAGGIGVAPFLAWIRAMKRKA